MSMSNFVIREAILPALTATTKEEAIRQMVKSLQQAGYFRESEIEEIVAAVMRREQLGSTGIGRSIAIPHSRFGGVDRLIGTVAISQEGIPFDSIDGEPVHILILFVSPQDRPGDHLRALEAVVRLMRDDRYVKELRQTTTRDAIWHLLDSAQPTWNHQ